MAKKLMLASGVANFREVDLEIKTPDIDLNNWLRKELTRIHVPFYDECCGDIPPEPSEIKIQCELTSDDDGIKIKDSFYTSIVDDVTGLKVPFDKDKTVSEVYLIRDNCSLKAYVNASSSIHIQPSLPFINQVDPSEASSSNLIPSFHVNPNINKSCIDGSEKIDYTLEVALPTWVAGVNVWTPFGNPLVLGTETGFSNFNTLFANTDLRDLLLGKSIHLLQADFSDGTVFQATGTGVIVNSGNAINTPFHIFKLAGAKIRIKAIMTDSCGVITQATNRVLLMPKSYQDRAFTAVDVNMTSRQTIGGLQVAATVVGDVVTTIAPQNNVFSPAYGGPLGVPYTTDQQQTGAILTDNSPNRANLSDYISNLGYRISISPTLNLTPLFPINTDFNIPFNDANNTGIVPKSEYGKIKDYKFNLQLLYPPEFMCKAFTDDGTAVHINTTPNASNVIVYSFSGDFVSSDKLVQTSGYSSLGYNTYTARSYMNFNNELINILATEIT